MKDFPTDLSKFAHIWVTDFEYCCPDGERPDPRCMVARDYKSGETIRLWLQRESHLSPFGPDDLLVAFYASAEIGCFLQLGWTVPKYTLDLYPEFRNFMGSRRPLAGFGLLGVAAHCGIQSTTTSESKDSNRALAQKSSFTSSEKEQLLDYCEEDVVVTGKVLEALLPKIPSLPRALLRGRYMKAAAHIEENGIPIDVETLDRLVRHWEDIKHSLIAAVDCDFGVYQHGVFKGALWREYCQKHGIQWPVLDSGSLDFKDETFRLMAARFPKIHPIRELRATLDQMKLNSLAVGKDGRNRYRLWAFASTTGRNQPSSTDAIFGPATWIRNLIAPAPGMAVAYIDYEQQEFAIAAVLSNDEKMKAAYASGDPYLEFAKQAGGVPLDATKQTHSAERDQFKATALGVQFGMGAASLGMRIGQSEPHGKALINHHKNTYTSYWKWSDCMEAQGMMGIPLQTVFGWRTYGKEIPNPRSFRNFPTQANGAEMLRIAIIALVEAGITVCAPVHDAVLIEAPVDQIESIVSKAQRIMEKASQVILYGFTVRTDAKIIRYPHHYSDPRGEEMWAKVTAMLNSL